VTFKNMVASLTPQISYFTTLDQYVFFCFIISCLVAIENALFPLFVGLFPSHERWQEHSLLGFSIGFFTLVNIVWFLSVVRSVKKHTYKLPVDKSIRTEGIDAKAVLHAVSRQQAEREFDTFKRLYEELNPSGSLLNSSAPDSEKPLRAAKPNEAFLAGGGDRRRSVIAPSSPVGPLRMQSQVTRRRAWSRTSEFE
ncbi:hypothetical protein PC123_g6120, partial [Phytophthora cactorum]